jgi:hypothetical protein
VSAFYDRMAATALRLITKYGKTTTVTFNRYAPSVSAPGGTVTKGSATNTSTATVVVVPIGRGSGAAFSNRLEDGTLADQTLSQIKVAASSMTFEPKSMDEVSMDSLTWQVVGCSPINPAGTPIVYDVGLTKL